jgi:hypothetical protein
MRDAGLMAQIVCASASAEDCARLEVIVVDRNRPRKQPAWGTPLCTGRAALTCSPPPGEAAHWTGHLLPVGAALSWRRITGGRTASAPPSAAAEVDDIQRPALPALLQYRVHMQCL